MRNAGYKILACAVAVVVSGSAASAQPGMGQRGRGMATRPGMQMRGMGGPAAVQPGPWRPAPNIQVGRGPGAVWQRGPSAQQRQVPVMQRGRAGRPAAGARAVPGPRGARAQLGPARGWAAPGGAPRLGFGAGMPLARCTQWLGLTEEQQDKIQAIVREAVAERAEKRAEILTAIKGVLTEEQARELEELQGREPLRDTRRGRGVAPEQRPGWRQGPVQGFGPGQGMGRGLRSAMPQVGPGPRQGRGGGAGWGPGSRR